MKLRAGFVSQGREDLEKIKKEFPEIVFIYAQNVMELFQHSSAKNLDCVILMGSFENLSKEFYGSYNYLRQKPIFKQTPILALSNSKIVAAAPINDSRVRSFSVSGGVFTALIDYFSQLTQSAQEAFVTTDKMIAEFSSAISRKYNKAGNISAREATNDESHSSFISQGNFEIASNLYWVKFSSRILSKSTESLMAGFGSKDEAALHESLINLQAGIFDTFREHLDEILDSKGALKFKKSDQLNMADKIAYIKKASSKYYIFDSPAISIVLEIIQYI